MLERPTSSLARGLALAACAASGLLGAARAQAADDENDGHVINVAVLATPEVDFGPGLRLSAREHQFEWRAPEGRVAGARTALGLRYAYTRYEYTGIASRNRDLHELQLPLSISGRAGGWDWRLEAAPGIATSSNVFRDRLRQATAEDLFATGGVSASRPLGGGALALGLAHDRRFGRSLTYPRIALRGERDTVAWQLGAPDAWLDLRPREGTALTLGVGPGGMQWHTVRDDFASDFDYRVRRWEARVMLRQRIVGDVSLSLHAGRRFERRHRFETDTFVPLDLDAEDANFFGIGIVFGARRRADGYAEAW